VQGGGGSRPARDMFVLALSQRIEMTLVKSLYSGDPDVIGYNVDVIGLHDRWCYSGKSHEHLIDSRGGMHSPKV